MRRGDHAHVDAQRRAAPHAVELALGQHAQQAHLQREAHVADLVQEQRAAVRLLEAPAAHGVRARERAPLVAEQFRLQQLRGDRRGVERDERAIGARAVPVQCARDQLLAGAGLSGHEHREARAGQAADRAEHLLHRRRLAEDAGDRRGRVTGAAGAARRRRAANERDSFVDVERLRQVLERAAAVGRDRMVQVGMRSHDDHRQVLMVAPRDLEQAQALGAGHAHVGQQHVRPAAAQRLEGRVRVVEAARLHATLAQRALEHPADRRVVVHDPDFKRLRHVRSPSAAAAKTRCGPGGCRTR